MLFYCDLDTRNAPCAYIGVANVICISLGFSAYSQGKPELLFAT